MQIAVVAEVDVDLDEVLDKFALYKIRDREERSNWVRKILRIISYDLAFDKEDGEPLSALVARNNAIDTVQACLEQLLPCATRGEIRDGIDQLVDALRAGRVGVTA